MQRRTILKFLIAAPGFAATPLLAAPQRGLRPPLPIVDRRSIRSDTKTISFVHRSGINPCGALRIMAKGHAVWLNSVKVTYRGGLTQVEKFNLNIPPNASSPAVTLAHDSNLLRRIDISLVALPLGSGRGEILVWDEPAMDPIHTASE